MKYIAKKGYICMIKQTIMAEEKEYIHFDKCRRYLVCISVISGYGRFRFP